MYMCVCVTQECLLSFHSHDFRLILRDIRSHNNNKLSGLMLDAIVQQMKDLIDSREKSGLDKPSLAAAAAASNSMAATMTTSSAMPTPSVMPSALPSSMPSALPSGSSLPPVGGGLATSSLSSSGLTGGLPVNLQV